MQPSSPNFGAKLATKVTQSAPVNHGAISANQMKGPKNLQHVGQQSSPFDKNAPKAPGTGAVTRQEVVQLINQLVPPMIMGAMQQDQQQDQAAEQQDAQTEQPTAPSPLGV